MTVTPRPQHRPDVLAAVVTLARHGITAEERARDLWEVDGQPRTLTEVEVIRLAERLRSSTAS